METNKPTKKENPESKIIDMNSRLKNMYLETLNEKELKAYAIAKSHLGTSFQLEKSHGFLNWKRNNTDIE